MRLLVDSCMTMISWSADFTEGVAIFEHPFVIRTVVYPEHNVLIPIHCGSKSWGDNANITVTISEHNAVISLTCLKRFMLSLFIMKPPNAKCWHP